MATQFFFTLSFIGTLIGIVFIAMYLLFVHDHQRVRILKWTGINLIVSGNFIPLKKSINQQKRKKTKTENEHYE